MAPFGLIATQPYKASLSNIALVYLKLVSSVYMVIHVAHLIVYVSLSTAWPARRIQHAASPCVAAVQDLTDDRVRRKHVLCTS